MYGEGEREDRPALEGDRWCLPGPAKAHFTTTEGGAAIDTSFRVLDEAGHPIPGLFAVGQNGLGGQILWGHGLHIADARAALPLTNALPFVTRDEPSRRRRQTTLRFSRDAGRVYVISDGTAWTIPLDELRESIPDDAQLAAWTRVLSAHHIDESGGYVPLTTREVRDAVGAAAGSGRAPLVVHQQTAE